MLALVMIVALAQPPTKGVLKITPCECKLPPGTQTGLIDGSEDDPVKPVRTDDPLIAARAERDAAALARRHEAFMKEAFPACATVKAFDEAGAQLGRQKARLDSAWAAIALLGAPAVTVRAQLRRAELRWHVADALVAAATPPDVSRRGPEGVTAFRDGLDALAGALRDGARAHAKAAAELADAWGLPSPDVDEVLPRAGVAR